LIELTDAVRSYFVKKIHFTPPPPFSLPRGTWEGAYEATGTTEMNSATVGDLQRYRNNGDRVSKREYSSDQNVIGCMFTSHPSGAYS
jgi:hypothetical protein